MPYSWAPRSKAADSNSRALSTWMYSGMPATGPGTSTLRSASQVSFGSTACVNTSATDTVDGGSSDTVNPATTRLAMSMASGEPAAADRQAVVLVNNDDVGQGVVDCTRSSGNSSLKTPGPT